VAEIVGWRLRAGVVLYAEAVEAHAERERLHLPAVVEKHICGVALTDVQHTTPRREKSDGRTCEYKQKRQMQCEYREPAPKPSADDDDSRLNGKQNPQSDKPRGMVDVAGGEVAAVSLFDERAHGKYRKYGNECYRKKRSHFILVFTICCIYDLLFGS